MGIHIITNNNEQFDLYERESYDGCIYPWHMDMPLNIKIQPELGKCGYYINLIVDDLNFVEYFAAASILNMTIEEYTKIMVYRYYGFMEYHRIWFKTEKDAETAADWMNSIVLINKLTRNRN